MKHTISIVLACDSRYLQYTYVTIYSVLKSRKQNYRISFYIMVPQNTEITNQYDVNWKFGDYEIKYIRIPEHYFSAAHMIEHITKPTYYRLLIPNILTDVDKCIYLDVDTLICDDLSELYKQDLSNVYLAAGLGINVFFTEEEERKLANYLQIPSAKEYFNAGVLVMNLKKMRMENMADIFLECSKKGWRCQDQDVLNICCYGKIRRFPLKYNIYSLGYGYRKELMEIRFSREEIEEALKKPYIIHYATGKIKPWNNLKAVKAREWWQMAQNALPENIYGQLYQSAEEKTALSTISDVFPKFDIYRESIIFGCGEAGKTLFDFLQRFQHGKVIGFWDNNPQSWGKIFKDVPVMEPEMKKNENTLIIISCQRESEKVKEQLHQLGFQDRQIAIYKSGDLDEWFATDFKYREKIKEDLKCNLLCNQ